MYQCRGETGQVTLHTKGDESIAVLLSLNTWKELSKLRADSNDDDPVFISKKGGKLDPSQVFRIVRKAAERANINKPVSPHWLRHAHASHALDRGCPIHLVKETLGHKSIAITGQYLHVKPEVSSSKFLSI
jgi:site-specific recombinase XerD